MAAGNPKGPPGRKIPQLGVVIFSIGHSTRSLDDLLQLLRAHGVQRLVDIRSIPRSRHNSQFNRETLSRFLRNRRIAYRHMKSLGGLRHARADSLNKGWRNASFRGYADYMQTPEFEEALGKLIALAEEKRTAVLCAEAVPWRCHRSLLADALCVRGFRVRHILGRNRADAHRLSPMAKVRGTRVTYPPE